MAKNSTIIVEHCDALAIVRFNRPERLNALDDGMLGEWVAAMNTALASSAVRAVLMTWLGRAFCSGADLKDMFAEQKAGQAPDVGAKLGVSVNPVLVRMREADKRIIAAVNGPAVGVGCGIALAADIVLAARSAYFQQSFIRLGVVPDGGSSWLLSRLFGQGRGLSMMMRGDRVDADRALAWGMVDEVYREDALAPAAMELARAMAQGPTKAYAAIKRMARASAANTFSAQLDVEAVFQQEAFQTSDCVEGIAAFVEKRSPRFTGE